MDIKTYLSAAEKRYNVRLKTVVLLDDEAMDLIERTVAKYHPLSISRPKKTMFQSHPLDFRQVENAEVYIVDMTFALPASPYVLAREIAHVLGAPESFVIARGENDPTELENERLAAVAEMDAEAAKRGLKPAAAILTTGEYPEVEARDGSELYGNAANSAFLAYLDQVRQEKEKDLAKTVSRIPAFSWLNLPEKAETGGQEQPTQDTTDFNKDIEDKPSVIGRLPKGVSKQGNLDGDTATVKRVYTDEDGKQVVLTRSIKGLRGE